MNLMTIAKAVFTGVVDRCIRQSYRIAYPIIMRCRAMFKYRHDSVLMAVWVNGHVLGVQHSYQPGLRLPGGGIRRREAPCAAAARELREEVGINIQPADLTLVATYGPRRSGSYTHVFAIWLPMEPGVTIDRREIVFAGFMPPSSVIHSQYTEILARASN